MTVDEKLAPEAIHEDTAPAPDAPAPAPDPAAAIQARLGSALERLEELRLDELTQRAVVSARTEARVLDTTAATRSAEQIAKRALAKTQEAVGDQEALVRALERGLERAKAGARADAQRRWAEAASRERARTKQDNADARDLLIRVNKALQEADAYLRLRGEQLETIVTEAAREGISLNLHGPRPLSASYRPWRTLTETLDALARERAPLN